MQSQRVLFCCCEMMNSDECSYPEIVKDKESKKVLRLSVSTVSTWSCKNRKCEKYPKSDTVMYSGLSH
jgi:hypothetical protein